MTHLISQAELLFQRNYPRYQRRNLTSHIAQHLVIKLLGNEECTLCVEMGPG